MINVYSDKYQTALKYIKDIEVNLCNVLVIAEDFNIRDSNWDPSYLFHLTHSDSLLEIAGFFDLKSLVSIQQIPTHYANNLNDVNLVIDLPFLYSNSIETNNHHILLELWYLSNYTPLIVNISITEEFIQQKHWTIIRNSEEEANFISEFTNTIGNINMLIPDKDSKP